MSDAKIISCGMYAFNDSLREAWRELFAALRVTDDNGNPVEVELDFGLVDSVSRERLLCGHTCGYPYIKHLAPQYSALLVPVFEAPGAAGKNYSSRIIVPADSSIETLADCRGGVVAVNGFDSNSGMNLLRYELARIGASPGFFSEVRTSGGHLHSLEAVAEGSAQLAAIDCISFQLIADQQPQLVDAVKSIGFTAACAGLPFVIARERNDPAYRASLLQAFRQALASCSSETLGRLHLRAFEAVDDSDYAGILELENYAISTGYAELN